MIDVSADDIAAVRSDYERYGVFAASERVTFVAPLDRNLHDGQRYLATPI